MSKNLVTAVFRDRSHAERAFEALQSHGYSPRDINVLMSDKTRSIYVADHGKNAGTLATGSKAAEGMGVGGAIGTAIGATIAAVAAVGTSIALPGLGLIVAGPLAAALAGGGAGAVTGGLLGALVGFGIPEKDTAVYDKALQDGGVVIGVTSHSAEQAKEAEELLKTCSGEQICRV